jgi:hypothetical protein
MSRSIVTVTSGAFLAALFWTVPAAGQLPGASSATLATANNYMALARGFTAVGLNPAGLGMPGTPGFSLALAPIRGTQTLDPITLSEVADFEGRLIPQSVKEDWLRQIASAGRETGGGELDLTLVSFNVRNVGFQFSTIGSANAALNGAAAELLLFGNAGLTGSPRDLDLQGSRMDGFIVSTFGVAVGIPLELQLGSLPDQSFALGATLKYSVGNALALGVDAGSLVQSDPILVDLEFPVLHSDTEDMEINQGSGVGLDLGVAWEGGPWSAGLAIQNLFHTFEWDLDAMVYRPGEALFNEDVHDSDFDERPASGAPSALKDEVAELKFKPVVGVGASFDALEDLTVTGEVRRRLGEGMATGPQTHVGVGVEYRPAPVIPLRAGVAAITGGFQVGGGLELALGPVHLGFAGAIRRGDGGDGALGMFSLSFGGG